MSDPFKIVGPAVVSFSGGRTSGMMLHRILEAHGGTLPEDVKVCFQNTGKERTETLDFVERCSCEWNMPVVWTEYRCVDGNHTFALVDYATASRNGEPFDAILAHHAHYRDAKDLPAVLPNPVQRFCTSELKMRTMRRYCVSLGWENWTNAVGMRADEPQRVAKLRAQRERWDNCVPLAEAGITEPDVMRFWAAQPFDLQLKQHEGNCDLCFLKSRGKIDRIIREKPELATWWLAAESRSGQRFRKDRPNYFEMMRNAREQKLLPGMEDEESDELSIACHCAD